MVHDPLTEHFDDDDDETWTELETSRLILFIDVCGFGLGDQRVFFFSPFLARSPMFF